MSEDKDEIADFLRRVVKAAHEDAFSEPDMLQLVLGCEVLGWKATQIKDGDTTFEERVAQRIRTHVHALDERGSPVDVRYLVREPNRHFRFSFSIHALSQRVCMTERDIEGMFGAPDERTGPLHNLKTQAGESIYRIAGKAGVRPLVLNYVVSNKEKCLDDLHIRGQR